MSGQLEDGSVGKDVFLALRQVGDIRIRWGKGSPCKMGLLLKERVCSCGSKLFCLRVDPHPERRQN